MKYDKFRRSTNVEDFTDPKKPVKNEREGTSIADTLKLTGSQLAHDLGADDIIKKPEDKKA